MLNVIKLHKSFGGLAAVDGASFEINKGRITALIGPNGAGKTTLFNLLSGTSEADQGTIVLDGEDITKMSIENRARHGISRSFQLSRPFRNLTVEEHLLLALEDEDDSFWKSVCTPPARGGARGGGSQNFRQKKLLETLATVKLDVSLEQKAADLSYGQSKLLGIAMAIIHPHRLMLLDEPVAGVNPVVRGIISEVLRKLREQGETVFVIEHDMEFIMPLADRVIVMDHGKVIANGTPEEIKKDRDVLNAYLGQQL